MDKFLSTKELEKEHEVVVDLNKLDRAMKAKTVQEMKDIMNDETEKVKQEKTQQKKEDKKETKKEELIVKKLFDKLDKGEEVKSNDKLIKGSFKTKWIYRPAPVQRDIYSKDFAYKEKDEEYNIWYDRYIEDEIIVTRKAAESRCDPTIHSGFTKADLLNFKKNYFCFHFANGKCMQGHQCSYCHHVPSLDECLTIDNSRDIFGRERFATHRADKEGVGTFLKESRTLKVGDMAIIYEKDKNTVKAVYECLWRHFGLYGEIEDIFVIPSSCVAYIR
jgi:hypothetical protein